MSKMYTMFIYHGCSNLFKISLFLYGVFLMTLYVQVFYSASLNIPIKQMWPTFTGYLSKSSSFLLSLHFLYLNSINLSLNVFVIFLEGDLDGEFVMGGDPGSVLLATQLDCEAKAEYNLTVAVSNGIHTSFAQVIISYTLFYHYVYTWLFSKIQTNLLRTLIGPN